MEQENNLQGLDAGSLTFEGVWQVELFNGETGEKEYDYIQKNVICDNGIIAICSGTLGPAGFNFLHIGTASSPTTPSPSDLALNSDFFTGNTTHKNISARGTYAFQKICSLGLTDAVGLLTEAGLFSANSIMFNRIVFANGGIQKLNTQTAFITTTITIRKS